MKITIAQLNPIIGDTEGNTIKLLDAVSKFHSETDLVVFPELFITGYPPRDILERKSFIRGVENSIKKIVQKSKDYPEVGILFGVPLVEGEALYNAAIVVSGGKIIGKSFKALLPVYDVFDESRYFKPAGGINVVPFKDEKLGISICEDMWNSGNVPQREEYDVDPVKELAGKGATIMINLSASPFHAGKERLRYEIIKKHVKEYKIPFIFVNQVGSNDELVFDGRSLALNKDATSIAVFPGFTECVQTIDIEKKEECSYLPLEIIYSVYEALKLGTNDYLGKCGFKKAVVGLSGGIDSAVTCAIAKDAVGADNVLGISMPSRYSSKESIKYARSLAKNLGIEFKEIPIDKIYASYLKSLSKDLKPDVPNDVEVFMQNLQARIRGNILMAFSNKMGHLVLTTGNKSETAMGYCTLYGDMAGGLAVISDIPKTMVYKLAEYINRDKEVIPQGIIERAPSAELKPDQLDQDSLPPYDILDKILHKYLEESSSQEKLIEMGFDPEVVKSVTKAVVNNEYKRRQAPPGLKVTTKAFGMGRRMPIAAKYSL